MTIYSTSSYGGDAILIAPEWRIEVGSPPYVNGMYDARIGHAYRSPNGVGLYAAWAGDEGMRHALAFDTGGRNVEFKEPEAVIAFPNWRIVIGAEEAPFVIAEFGDSSDSAASG